MTSPHVSATVISYLCKNRIPGHFNKTTLRGIVSTPGQEGKAISSLTGGVRGECHQLSQRTRLSEDGSGARNVQRKAQGREKMQTPHKLCACPSKQSSQRSAGELGARLGHRQGSPKSPKLITASALRDAFNCVQLNCSFSWKGNGAAFVLVDVFQRSFNFREKCRE